MICRKPVKKNWNRYGNFIWLFTECDYNFAFGLGSTVIPKLNEDF